jgi:hypothetical protein
LQNPQILQCIQVNEKHKNAHWSNQRVRRPTNCARFALVSAPPHYTCFPFVSYKATIMQRMPELQAVGSGVSTPAPCSETPAPPVIQQPAGVSAIAGSGLTEAQAIAGNDGALHESEDLECKLKACGGEAE